MDPRTSVISLPELAPSVRTSAAKSLKFPGPTNCTSELAPSVGNIAATSLKFEMNLRSKSRFTKIGKRPVIGQFARTEVATG